MRLFRLCLPREYALELLLLQLVVLYLLVLCLLTLNLLISILVDPQPPASGLADPEPPVSVLADPDLAHLAAADWSPFLRQIGSKPPESVHFEDLELSGQFFPYLL